MKLDLIPESKREHGGLGGMRARLLLLLAVLLPSIACDQATKVLAVTHLKGTTPLALDLAPFSARLIYAENPGAFLGLGRALPDGLRLALLTIAVGLMLVGMAVVLLRRPMARGAAIGLALLIAGGLGNLIDRVARPGGRVVDFAQLGVHVGPLDARTGVFNVADVAIMGGAAAIALETLRRRRVQRHS